MSGAPPSHDLSTLQRWFAHVMTHAGGVEEGVRSSAASGAGVVDPSQAARIVLPNDSMTALQRIGVYHYAYRARLIECMADDYPALRYALGSTAFDALCSEYIERFPSHSPTLETFADEVPALCEEKGNPFAADLARLEWAIVTVIHAPDPAPLMLADLATLEPQDFAKKKLLAKTGLQLLEVRHPVNDFYHAFRHDQAPPIPAPQAGFVLVHRRGPTVYRRDLSAPAVQLLSRLIDGMPIANALAADGGSDETQIGDWFREWIGAGLFTGLVSAG